MGQGHNYIATWFYRESHEEASFYPQAGGRGDSELLHSVYMQIQVPFFTTFRHYNPQARMNQHYLYDILDESSFWKKAEVWYGVSRNSLRKRLIDLLLQMQAKLKP